MELFLRIFGHLLPRSKAWTLAIDKLLRKFFEGLSGLPSDFKDFIDLVWLDIFPTTTRQLTEWEAQFGIVSPATSDSDRRDAITAAWLRGGGQGKDTLQDVLQAAGFPLFVHDPWFFALDYADAILCGEEEAECGGEGVECGEQAERKFIRDPNLWLSDADSPIVYIAECGEAVAECGEPTALCGDTAAPAGLLLVNKLTERVIIYTDAVTCGEASAACGESSSECGDNTGFISQIKGDVIPSESDTWAYFWYIGGETFGEFVVIPTTRKDELETLILGMGPVHTWAGLFVTYGG